LLALEASGGCDYTPGVPETLPLATRVWFAFVCFFRVLFDGAFAARAFQARLETPALEAPESAPEAEPPPTPSVTSALQLLSLLQREGRLVDFVQQDIASFADAEVGAAARVVHEGCRRALSGHVKILPIRSENEGASVSVEDGYDPASLKLIGDVGGGGKLKGTLRHRGWRAESLELPRLVGDHDPHVLAPAEVEV
jgi:hypothetical protein